MSATEFQQKLQKLREVRSYYTHDGIFREFEKFLRDPFGTHGGYLRCGPHPKEAILIFGDEK